MSRRQRLYWRVMGLERRLSGTFRLCRGEVPSRPDPAAGAQPPESPANGTKKPAEAKAGHNSSEHSSSGSAGKPSIVQVPQVEPTNLKHLQQEALFASGSRVPKVSELGGDNSREKLESLRKWLEGCECCPLCTGRSSIVFGEGSPDARLVFVGEGPGAEEDRTGRPFVGRAGKLLTQMIQAMGTSREDVFICNIVKCRPPNNRAPNADEVAACGPVLYRQLEIIQPELIITLGGPATQTLLETKEGITRLHGRLFQYGETLLLPTFHPAYLLRSPAQKKPAWQDLQIACKLLGLKPRRNRKSS